MAQKTSKYSDAAKRKLTMSRKQSKKPINMFDIVHGFVNDKVYGKQPKGPFAKKASSPINDLDAFFRKYPNESVVNDAGEGLQLQGQGNKLPVADRKYSEKYFGSRRKA